LGLISAPKISWLIKIDLKYCTQKGGSLEATSDFETVCGGLRTSLGCAIPSQYSGVRCINRSTADVKHKLVTHFLFSECSIWHRACNPIWHIYTYLTAWNRAVYMILFTYVPWPYCCLQVIRIVIVSCYRSALAG
jgi:hypothetical protein